MAASLAIAVVTVGPSGGSPARAATGSWTGTWAASPQSASPSPTAAQLIPGIQQLVGRAHRADVRFRCSPLTPYRGAGYWTSQGETAREAVNSFARGANSGCDGVVDQDAVTHDPANPTRYLPAYDSGDHLHPNDAGMQAIASAVDVNLFGSATSTPAVSLRAHANGGYVCAENAGASALIAICTAVGPWEQFDLIQD